MFNKAGTVIYVGKAKNLRHRVASYFSGSARKDLKTQQLVAHIDHIEVTVTQNEVEAWLLELQLIKQLKPKYNIIFKDDKSYPYIWLDTKEKFAPITFFRGHAEPGAGEFFGPYPSTKAVREALDLIQRMFKLRQCDKNFFANRTRPCLQYQIKRCSAPCVGLIDETAYQEDLRNAKLFLAGKSKQVANHLHQAMDSASQQLAYERAAQIRDQISLLRKIQQHQVIIEANVPRDLDVLGVACANGYACIHVLTIRDGRILGSRQYYPTEFGKVVANGQEILSAFISQHYTTNVERSALPTELVIPRLPDQQLEILQELLRVELGIKIRITATNLADYKGAGAHKGSHAASASTEYRQWLTIAQQSAEQALQTQCSNKHNFQQRLQALTTALGLAQPIQRIECFDISHTFGTATVGACVVFGSNGAIRSDYRRYNIKLARGGDDYAALREALTRHYTKLKTTEAPLPDLLIIDGGKGQLAQGEAVLRSLQITGVILLGVAKGVTRKPGLETLYLSAEGLELELEPHAAALLLIQQIRDEAHNLAIKSHRRKRDKLVIHSSLDDILGIGAKRRRDLLARFGGVQELRQALVTEIAQVPGISKVLAERIYTALHRDN